MLRKQPNHYMNNNEIDFETELSFENRYNIMSKGAREYYINKLFEPYKIRKHLSEVLKEYPNYNESTIRKKGIIKQLGCDSLGNYIIFFPRYDEFEKIELFAKIDEKQKKLIDVKKLQLLLRKHNQSFEEIQITKAEIDNLYKEIFESKTENPSNKADKKTETHWFKVGLEFAKGTIQELNKSQGLSYTEIAIKLGNKNYRPYISETLSNKPTNEDKVIYNDKAKMEFISEYCQANKILICEDFKVKLNKIKQD